MIKKSPGDGYCMLHSVQSSWLNQLPNRLGTYFKAQVYIETVWHPEYYAPFLDPGTNLQLFKGLSQYLLHKCYNQNVGDKLLTILNNGFNIQLDIFNETNDSDIQEI